MNREVHVRISAADSIPFPYPLVLFGESLSLREGGASRLTRVFNPFGRSTNSSDFGPLVGRPRGLRVDAAEDGIVRDPR
jgi:hypothetical protein